tara:strand:+ start:628 stop:1155 length:528 start_codon:yes stop_codon:yes gene_type:complete
MADRTVIQLPRLASSDLLDERNNFLIHNDEDGKTYRVDDLQMDERFLSANSRYGNNIRQVIERVNNVPYAVVAGNEIIMTLGPTADFSSFAARLDITNNDDDSVNTYKFAYVVNKGEVQPLEFVWHENHQHVVKGETAWSFGDEDGTLRLRLASRQVLGQAPSLILNFSDVSLGL